MKRNNRYKYYQTYREFTEKRKINHYLICITSITYKKKTNESTTKKEMTSDNENGLRT